MFAPALVLFGLLAFIWQPVSYNPVFAKFLGGLNQPQVESVRQLNHSTRFGR